MNHFEGTTPENACLVLLTLSRGAESRKKILTILLSGPKNCNQIATELKLDWWTVERHLRILLKESIIVNLQFGCIKFYKLSTMGEKLLKKIATKKETISESKAKAPETEVSKNE